MNAERRPTLRWWWLGTLLVALGMAGSAYLLLRTFTLLAPGANPGLDVCSMVFAASCDATLADTRSWILEIPPAGWGLVVFAAIGALLALARFVEGEFEVQALSAASALAIAELLAGSALTIGALVESAPICPMCITLHATSLALVLVLQRAIARPPREQLALLCASWARLARPGGATPETARWQFVGFGCVALVAATAYQWVFIESALRRPGPAERLDRGAAITTFKATPQRELPVTADDPHRGPLDAPVRLVVFESLQCLHCQRFAPTLARLKREFGDRLLVVFKHYPLSKRCNGKLPVDVQPDACEIAWAAEAAHRQSRFWEFHDAFLAGSRSVDARSIARAAQGAGVDPARFEADRRSVAVRERVAADIALGNRLKLPGTPATYLDGRLVRRPSAELLEILIRHELERTVTRNAPVGPSGGESFRPRAAATTIDGRLIESASSAQAVGTMKTRPVSN